MLKRVLPNLIYALLVAGILMVMDKSYALSNHYFIFNLTFKEFCYKLAPIALLISFIPKQRWRFLFLSLILLASLFEYIHFSYFGKNITAMEFGLIGGNGGEILDAMKSMKAMMVVPLLIVLGGGVALWSIEKIFAPKLFHYPKWYLVMGGFFLFLILQINYVLHMKLKDHHHAVLNSESKLLYPVYHRHSSRNFFVVLNYYLWGVMPKQILHADETQDVREMPKLVHDTNATIVLVIGESLRADKFSLADNPLTPNLQTLQKDPNFFANTILSAGTITKVSVSTLINHTNTPNPMPQIFSQKINLFRLAKEAGYHTAFISAQTRDQLKIIRDFLGLKYIDEYYTRDDFPKEIQPGGYDDDLLKMVQKRQLLHPKSLVVLQMRGSHEPYDADYPKSFAKTNSDYDNSVLLSDSVLYHLIQMLKKEVKGEFIFLYASDHGELLGERGKRGHGQFEPEVYHVPFVSYLHLNHQREMMQHIHDIKCHFDMGSVILRALGYDEALHFNDDRNITILNADLEEFSGYGIALERNGTITQILKRAF